MLHFILGRAGSGKTTHVHRLLEDFARAGRQEMILLVPEQYSFHSERAMLERLGPADAGKIEVLSFSRLAHSVFRLYGGKNGRPIDDAGRAILMSLALESVGDELEVYGRHRQSPALITEMLGLAAEFKQGAVAPAQMMTVSDNLADCLLKKKTREISLVLSAYDALVAQSYFDEYDELTNLYDTLFEHEYFSGKIVAVDAFRGFTGQELKIIERILAQAQDTYITICADGLYPLQGDTGVFGHTKRTAGRIVDIAKKLSVPIAQPLMLSGGNNPGNSPPIFSRCTDAALCALEAGLYNPFAAVYEQPAESVTLTAASDIVGECEFVAVTIKKLLREEGLRCREIAVIAGTAETYEAQLKSALKKCDVPVFIDKRQPVITQPLITLVRSALEMAAVGFTIDAAMRYLKTGLAGFSVEEISTLENYALLWNINGNRWLRDFTNHPGGYGSEMTADDRDTLADINIIRARAVEPLAALRAGFENARGEAAAKAVFDLLETVHAGENLKNLAVELEENGEPVLALEQERLWDDLMLILDSIATALKGSLLPAKRMREFFDLIISTRSLGSIPQGLDEITIGSADRIRTASPKAVFIVGANEGVFPRSPLTAGILNDSERQKLIDLGLKVSEPGEYKIMEERFIAYSALCSATQKLFVSYARKDLAGAGLSPSELVSQMQRLFPNCRMKDTADIPDIDYVEGTRPAFELTAKLWRKGDELYTALRACFAGRPDYADRLEALDRAAENKPFAIRDSQTAKALFGQKMLMSASRTESFSKCPFAYYCQYGLRARPRKAAELDPLQTGTVLHYVLQKLLEKYPAKALAAVNRDEIRAFIRALLDDYLKEKMGGMSEKPKRFAYLYLRLADTLEEVAARLAKEFETGSFEPVAFELKIGQDGDVAPYELALENGGTLTITGSIDRVDRMEKDGVSYIRIVDYKSGGKEFSLARVLDGINMQMLIYLFVLWQNGAPLYGNIVPAGVLYMAANAPTAKLERHAETHEIEKEKLKKSRMSGVLLKNTDVILGMESDGEGVFIPAYQSEKGLQGMLITLEQMGKLKAKTDEILTGMAAVLQDGGIPAYPAEIGGNKIACEYCDFAPACGHENGMPVRPQTKLKHEEVLALLEGEGGDSDAMDE